MKVVSGRRQHLLKREIDRRVADLEAAEIPDIADQPREEGEGVSKRRITKAEQSGIVAELIEGLETLSQEEFDGLYNQLDIDHQMEVDQSVREFADNAVGDEHWDSDN